MVVVALTPIAVADEWPAVAKEPRAAEFIAVEKVKTPIAIEFPPDAALALPMHTSFSAVDATALPMAVEFAPVAPAPEKLEICIDLPPVAFPANPIEMLSISVPGNKWAPTCPPRILPAAVTVAAVLTNEPPIVSPQVAIPLNVVVPGVDTPPDKSIWAWRLPLVEINSGRKP